MQGRKTLFPTSAVTPPASCMRCRHAAPSISCSCSDPPVLVCRACYGDHIFSPGDHVPSTIPNAPRPSLPFPHQDDDLFDPESTRPDYPCSCCGQPAQAVCCCQLPVKLLCELCKDDHEQTQSEKPHMILCIRAASYLKTTEGIGRMRRRMHQVDLAREKLLEIRERMNDAERQICEQLDIIADEVQNSKAMRCAMVQKHREQFDKASEEAMEEVNEHIYEDSYKPTSRLAHEIFNFREESSESLMSVFKFSIDSKKAISGLEQMATLSLKLTHTEGDRKAYTNCIPIVASTSLRMFSVESKSLTKYVLLSQPINISDSSAWIMLGDGSIFACGRMQPQSAAVYQIAIETGEVTIKKSMKIARHSHGMGHFKRTNKIYVFGGTGGTPETFLKSCEVYDPLLDLWTDSNGSMKEGRDCFNPALVEDKFFLVGGRNARTIELFSTVSETVTQMLVMLPYATSTSAIVDEGELVILQRDKILRWKIMSSDLKTAAVKDGTHMYSNTTPLRVENEVWLLRCLTGAILTVGLGKPGRAEAVQCVKTPVIY